jgi:hypothetical protein
MSGGTPKVADAASTLSFGVAFSIRAVALRVRRVLLQITIPDCSADRLMLLASYIFCYRVLKTCFDIKYNVLGIFIFLLNIFHFPRAKFILLETSRDIFMSSRYFIWVPWVRVYLYVFSRNF